MAVECQRYWIDADISKGSFRASRDHVRSIAWQRIGADAGDGDIWFTCGDDRLVPKIERHADAVETGAEISAGCRNSNGRALEIWLGHRFGAYGEIPCLRGRDAFSIIGLPSG